MCRLWLVLEFSLLGSMMKWKATKLLSIKQLFIQGRRLTTKVPSEQFQVSSPSPEN